MKNPQDRLAVFDVGNVLIGFSLEKAEANFESLEKGLGSEVRALWHDPLMTAFEAGRITPDDFFRRLKKKTGFTLSRAAFVKAFNDIFWPLPQNLQLLKRLSARHRVALLSNTNVIHWRHMHQTFPALGAAHHPWGSHQLKAVKPQKKIYHALAQKTGVPLRAMYYVDDRPDFVAAARTLGMTSHCYQGWESLAGVFSAWGFFK